MIFYIFELQVVFTYSRILWGLVNLMESSRVPNPPLSAGLNLETLNTILSKANHIWVKFKQRLKFFKVDLWFAIKSKSKECVHSFLRILKSVLEKSKYVPRVSNLYYFFDISNIYNNQIKSVWIYKLIFKLMSKDQPNQVN